MEKKFSLLIADEDKSQIITLQRLISNAFPELKLLTCADGNSVLSLVNQSKPDIIITGLNLPGCDGIELVKKIREKEEFKSIHIIITFSNSETGIKNIALEKGANDFLNKPVFSDHLISRIKNSLETAGLHRQIEEQNQLLNNLADELEAEMQDMIKLSVNFLNARIPGSAELLKRVAIASVWIAKEYRSFDVDGIRDLEIAAFLSQAGRIFLPDNLLKVPVLDNGMPTNPLLCQVPITGNEIVSSMRRFAEVGKIIRHIYENFDGSGTPDRLQSWQIPFSSRIIRVALDYEEFKERTKQKPREAFDFIRKESQRLYDHRVVVLLEHFIKSHEKEEYDPTEMAMQLADLKEGMILTRDIITDKGQKLLPAGAVLRQGAIEKIISHNSTDHILGHVHIRKY